MKLSLEEIKHIAELSRLELSGEEEVLFAKQLASVLDYVKSLESVDTKDVSPTAFLGGLKNVWRADEVNTWPEDESELALNQGEREGRFIKVKKVL